MRGAAPVEGDAVFGRHRDYLGEFRVYLVDELGRSPRTAESYGWSLRCLENWAKKPADELTSEDLRAFKRGADYAPSTVQGVVVALRSFHEWGALEGYWKLNGIRAVKTPRVVSPPKPPVSMETARILIESCRTALETRVVFCGLFAGLRISESANLTEREWRFDRLKLVGKGRKQREIPLHPELHKRKAEILSSVPSSAGVLHSSLDRLRTRTNARDLDGNPVPSHGLRRTFASTLYEQGTPYEIVGKLLGHGQDVTARYARLPWDRMEAHVKALNYYEGEATQLCLFE